MKTRIVLSTFLLVLLISTTSVFGQEIGYTTFHPQSDEEPRIKAIELTLERYNELFTPPGEDPWTSEHPLVTEDNTVWIYHEVPKPEESEDAFILNIPFAEESILHTDNTFADNQLDGVTSTSISGISFVQDATTSGFFHIPPDPSGAVGTTHVCHVVNSSIDCHTKAGEDVAGFPKGMDDFFTSLSPENVGFDPKILWDQYENKFVLVHLIKINTISRLLLAVSDGADPTGTWHFQAIDVAQNLSGTDSWFDYPCLAIDEEAIYVTGNYFAFLSNASQGHTGLVIIDKGVTGGIYDGVTSADDNPSTNSDFSLVDPTPNFDITLQPAHIHGTPPSGSIGTWLVGYSGLSNGVQEALMYGEITDPLGTPSFAWEFVFIGDVDNAAATMPDAPQSGATTDIETNDRRALDAVWRDNALWLTTTVVPGSGTNSGEATSLVIKINENGTATPTLAFAQEVGGEDIASGSSTYMASVSVNSNGDAAVGFSSSSATTFAGAFAVGVLGSTGTLTATQTVQAGVDDYVRTFGNNNRYGDYSRMALDPVDDGFWAINQAAIAGGNNFSGEDGQWQMFIREMDNLNSLLPVELAIFNAEAIDKRYGLLTWETATEQNNYGFVVEQFINDKFEEIGFVDGAGTTIETQRYEFKTEQLGAGTHFFRLRQMDYDGTEFLSEIKSIDIEGKVQNVIGTPVPNPFTNVTTFKIQLMETQSVQVDLVDINGKVVLSENGNFEANQEYLFEVNGENLPNGIYFLRIKGDTFSKVERLVLNR